MKPLAQNTLIQNRYLIVHLIGKGGMGEVYLAVDQRLGSAVALKRTFFAGDEMLGSAFEREARTLARMRHPVLPKVSDHFGEGDEQYLVMEHISGDDLAKRLELAQKPFPVSWVLFWADQLLDALSYLHTHEPPIIHRDIKPQNLKLTDENHIILLDFGLSKTSTGMTNVSQSGSTGSVVGYTPHYAPMEQIRGIGTSPKSDLYSLSATLYQLMTNKIPADALSRADSMLNGMADPITPPSSLNPEIPKAVSDVILKGMEVSQDRRYSDAREMQKVLRKAFNEMQQTSTAKTVAFNAIDQRAMAIEAPAADKGSSLHEGSEQTPLAAPSSAQGHHEGNNGGLDLNATMAFEDPPVSSSGRQADVKTEVFLAGGNSLPLPEKQSYESVPTKVNSVQPAPSAVDFAAGYGESQAPVSESVGFSPDATIPYISDPGLRTGTSESGSETQAGFYGTETAGNESYSGAGSRYIDSQQPESEVPPQAAYVNEAPSTVKKSSKKTLAVAGGLAALLLLTIVAGAGIWAYLNFAPGMTETDPISTPSPEPSFVPSPEPTLESIVDTNSSQVNGTESNNTNSTSNNQVLTVSPTPESTPVGESTPSAGPTPRAAPRDTPARPTGTPRERPAPTTRKTPAVGPTIIQ